MKQSLTTIASLVLTMSMAYLGSAAAQTTPFNSSAASPCPEVLIDQKYDHTTSARYRAAGWDTVVSCSQAQLELSAEPYIPVQFFNGTYLVEEVPYNPPDPTFSLGTQLPINQDDVFGSATTIAYPFYFFGIRKTSFVLGANGLVTFNGSASGSTCPWSYSAPIPWPDGTSGAPSDLAKMRDAIYGIYEDTDPNASRSSTANHSDPNWGIYYGIQDQFPCRKIICSWNDMLQFQCHNCRCTYQIVCYEGSNIIEVHVKQRRVCSGWNGGRGIIGIQNATGQPQQPSSNLSDPNYFVQSNSPASFAPSGCNITTSDITQKAYRFTPQGTTNKASLWFRLMPNGDSITLTQNPTDTNGYYLPMGYDPDHPTRTVAYVKPTVSSRYVMRLSFKNANNDWYHLYDTISIGVDTINDLTLTANTLTANSGDKKVFDICYGESAWLPLSYTRIQEPERVDWTIKRKLNGQNVDLPEDMINFTDNDTALQLLPATDYDSLPKNKIDTIFVRASVDFKSGCTNYDSIMVRIFPNFDTTEVFGICRGETFHWNNDNHNYTESTTTPQVTLHSQPGCDSVVHLDLTVFDVSLTVDPVVDCKPIVWQNGRTYNGTNSATAATDTIRLVNKWGCDSIVRLDFTMYPLTAKLHSSLESFDYDHIDVELEDISIGGISREWKFPTGADQTAPVAYYSIPANLDKADIKMIAYSPYGCVDSTHIVLPFNKETFWMPNAFTPDNAAGNSTFGSTSSKTIQQEMLIYNRYGELVFRCTEVDCQWDGRDLNGNPCPQGAYAYIIRYINSYEPNETKVRTGSVTLIR